jgi:integrase
MQPDGDDASARSRKPFELAPTPYRGTDDGEPHPQGRAWHEELPRWMATLNPGRTRREYEKAVGYFFLTPGVPSELQALTFDLLLAYRGALALRAAPLERGGAYAVSTGERGGPALGAPVRSALPGPEDAAEHAQGEDDGSGVVLRPLAPATVNIRLTALRQFLAHCSMMELLAGLTPDRIRLALRRLQIDRRRPYQILAESEWGEFLQAALLSSSDATRSGQTATSGSQRTGGSRDESTSEKTPAASIAYSTRQRNYALIALALSTGLRAIELSLLNLGDLSREWYDGHEEWWLVLPDEKSKGQHGGRTLPLAPELVGSLMSYVRSSGRRWEDPADRATPLFLSRQAQARNATEPDGTGRNQYRLSMVQIRRIVDRVEQLWLTSRAGPTAAGEPANQAAGETRVISPHALRHSTAVALLEGNASIGRPPASVEHVRGWLGHLDIRTTQGYLAHLESRRHRRPLALASMLPSGRQDSTGDLARGATPMSHEEAEKVGEVPTPAADADTVKHVDEEADAAKTSRQRNS